MNNTDNDLQRWIGGIPYEVAFWRSYYSNPKRRNDLFEWSFYNKPFDLENFDIHAYVRSLETNSPEILDVGCSLSYMLGNIIDGEPRHIHYVDPLAPFYNDILEQFSIDRPRIDFGMIETLSLAFESESVDLIHVRNALDHCADPYEGIIQCLEILKTGGVLYLNHHHNEAERENYRGFHQYNITDKDGNLIIWNRETRLNITERLRGFATVEVSHSAERNVVAIVTKTGSVPPHRYSRIATMHNMSAIMSGLMAYFHSSNNSTAYQLKRLYTTVGHRLMRLLPYSILVRVKTLFGRKSD